MLLMYFGETQRKCNTIATVEPPPRPLRIPDFWGGYYVSLGFVYLRFYQTDFLSYAELHICIHKRVHVGADILSHLPVAPQNRYFRAVVTGVYHHERWSFYSGSQSGELFKFIHMVLSVPSPCCERKPRVHLGLVQTRYLPIGWALLRSSARHSLFGCAAKGIPVAHLVHNGGPDGTLYCTN